MPRRGIPAQPTVFNTNPTRRVIFEWGGTGGAISSGVTINRLNIACWEITAANVGGNVITYGSYQGIRIKYIDIWGMPSDTVPSTVTLEWYGTVGSGRQKAATTLGTTHAPRIRCYPPPGSSAAAWTDMSSVIVSPAGNSLGQGGEDIFNITFNVAGAVVQAVCDVITNKTPGSAQLTSTVSATAVNEGQTYNSALNFSGQTGALNLLAFGTRVPLPTL